VSKIVDQVSLGPLLWDRMSLSHFSNVPQRIVSPANENDGRPELLWPTTMLPGNCPPKDHILTNASRAAGCA